MENISQPMEVNEVDLGDDTIIPPLSIRVGGSGNTPNLPLTMDTPPTNPPTLGTSPAIVDPLTLGSTLTPGDDSSGNSAYEKKQRQKTSKVWDDFS
jgi:hypothetical protein